MTIDNESVVFYVVCFMQLAYIEVFTLMFMFFWILKAMCLFLGNSFWLSYIYKHRKWIVDVDISPLKGYIYCFLSTLSMIYFWAWYVNNKCKTYKLGCNENYPLCLKIFFKRIFVQYRILLSTNYHICKT